MSSNRWVRSLFLSWCCVAGACSDNPSSKAASSSNESADTPTAKDVKDEGSAKDAGSSKDKASTGAAAGANSKPSTSSGSSTATTAGKAGSATGGNSAPAANSGDAGAAAAATDKFSFFVTSYAAMQRLSGTPDGFGGDLRYGEADGLAGADKICTEIAESSMAGAGKKGWRAFLSVTKGPDGNPIHAADRVGQGPWYDRLGRLIAQTREDLITSRPTGADPAIINDLPNEDGVPNHAPDGSEALDNHDVLTGTNDKGQLFSDDWGYTCHDWTSAQGSDGRPRVGHSWPRGMNDRGGFMGGPGGGAAGAPSQGRRPRAAAGSGGPGQGGPGGPGGPDMGTGVGDMANWMSALNEAGCAPGASLVEMGPPDTDNPTVGSGGGYGAIYCFALKP